jgi:hypothetical protein
MSSRGNGRRIAGRNSSAQNDLSGSAGARSGVSSPEQRSSRHQPAMSLRPGGIFERTGMARSRAGHRNAAASRRPRWQWEDRAIASGGNRTFASGRSSYNLDFVDMENEWENFENEDYDMEYYSGNSSDEGEDENLKSYEEDYIAFWQNLSNRGTTVSAALAPEKLAALDRFVEQRGGIPPSQAGQIPSRNLSLGGENENDGKKTASPEHRACCGVCLEDFAEGAIVYDLLCTHRFHVDCLRPWFARSKSCPMCRMNIELRASVYTGNKGSSSSRNKK